MKKLLILLLFAAGAKAQTTTADSAKYFEGSLKTICDTISSIKTINDTMLFVNFGGKYPNQTFTVKMTLESLYSIREVQKAFDNKKKVCFTGKVKIYKGKPEIVIKSKDQIRFPD